jgi:hypothetical protein
MAVLRGAERDEELSDRCIVGRSRRCDLVLAARDVSGEHAVVQWCGTHWEVRDLGSRNGTFVDDVRLAAGGRASLVAGSRLQFGRESPGWLLVDAAGPRAQAVALEGGARRVAEGGYLVLPDAEEPVLAVFQDGEGRWRVEQGGASRAAVDREVVEAGGAWRISLPAAAIGTWEDGVDLVLVARLRLRFAVSRDEEVVELAAFVDERRIDLQARTHHYPLLLLARRRLADAAAGVAAEEQGWLRQDEVLAMLRMKEDHFSVAIHRARAQLGKAGVADAAALIERRPGTRMLRIGVAEIEIAGLDAAGG